jgi:hypothetical protein
MIEDDTVQLKPTDTITVLGASRWEDGTPTDPATWKDWLIAVQISRLNRRRTLD